jgi:two-component system nitrogen regulation response regulator GlnG
LETASRRTIGPTFNLQALHRIVGESPAIMELREEIKRIAPYSVNVLVTGPTGTGKEVVARTIHQASPRSEKPFIPVDCASVTGTLFASHMFGHLKGAFTGATYTSLGCFRAAEGGTIFLDEIGEMEPALQAKLLRVLQQNTVVPVGGHEEIPVDVRVVAATNRDLAYEVQQGNFREDLYYRLNVVELHLAPLSERREDVTVLANHFLSELAIRHGTPRKQLEAGALAVLTEYSWPGNVRQLQNVLERLVLFSQSDVIMEDAAIGCLRSGARQHRAVADLSEADDIDLECESDDDAHDPTPPIELPDATEAWFSLDDLERKYIALTLKRTSYNQSAAAKLLQMDRSALRRRIEQLGVELPKSLRGRPRKPR